MNKKRFVPLLTLPFLLIGCISTFETFYDDIIYKSKVSANSNFSFPLHINEQNPVLLMPVVFDIGFDKEEIIAQNVEHTISEVYGPAFIKMSENKRVVKRILGDLVYTFGMNIRRQISIDSFGMGQYAEFDAQEMERILPALIPAYFPDAPPVIPTENTTTMAEAEPGASPGLSQTDTTMAETEPAMNADASSTNEESTSIETAEDILPTPQEIVPQSMVANTLVLPVDYMVILQARNNDLAPADARSFTAFGAVYDPANRNIVSYAQIQVTERSPKELYKTMPLVFIQILEQLVFGTNDPVQLALNIQSNTTSLQQITQPVIREAPAGLWISLTPEDFTRRLTQPEEDITPELSPESVSESESGQIPVEESDSTENQEPIVDTSTIEEINTEAPPANGIETTPATEQEQAEEPEPASNDTVPSS